jgi:hypothetical protein
VHQINQAADQQAGVLRISLDSKAVLKVGRFARGGYSRQGERACDHDFQADAMLTPFGILLPASGDNHLWFSQSKVTADFMVDRLKEQLPHWKQRFQLHTLVINADNGPESNGRRGANLHTNSRLQVGTASPETLRISSIYGIYSDGSAKMRFLLASKGENKISPPSKPPTS